MRIHSPKLFYLFVDVNAVDVLAVLGNLRLLSRPVASQTTTIQSLQSHSFISSRSVSDPHFGKTSGCKIRIRIQQIKRSRNRTGYYSKDLVRKEKDQDPNKAQGGSGLLCMRIRSFFRKGNFKIMYHTFSSIVTAYRSH